MAMQNPSTETTTTRSNGESTDRKPRKRGFAAMDRNMVRDLARKGGVAAHRAGTAHEFSSEEARVAGRKGGLATHGARQGESAAPSSTDPKLS
jgi:uncharacterized protein